MRKLLLASLVLFGATACGPAGSEGEDDILQVQDGMVVGPGKYRITDSGVRCARAPCPTLLASPVGAGPKMMLTGLEFPSDMPQENRARASERVHTSEGLVARGTVYGRGEESVFSLESVEP
ncbi:MAG TPA: hypothetical protein VF794_12255 [Archangium sp.]|jgi:hypothetical protein|uniref:hypothetical protein n=1 Tax=Archangium sp. TaxID=1872627 RepID=UPI002EDAF690